MDWIRTAPMILTVLILAATVYGYVTWMDLRHERRRSRPVRTEPDEVTVAHAARVALALAQGLEQAFTRNQPRNRHRAALPVAPRTVHMQTQGPRPRHRGCLSDDPGRDHAKGLHRRQSRSTSTRRGISTN